MNIKINISYIWLLIVLFIFLYDPPILKYSLLLHCLCAISLLFILKSKTNQLKFINILRGTKIWIFSSVLFFISLYLLVYDCISSTANVAYGRIYIYIILAVELVVISYYISLKYWKKNDKIYLFLRDILLVGNIQGGIALLSFISPEIKSFLVNVMYSNGVDQISDYLLSVRFYGFSNYLTSTTPIIQSVLACIAFWLALEKSYKYMICIPLLLFSAIINARSSLVIVGIGFAFVILAKANLKRKKTWKQILFLIVLIAFFIQFILPRLYSLESWEWIQSGIDEITAFFRGDEIGYFEYLSNSMFFPEKTYQVLLGTGHAIFRGNISSDVGYINDIWMIGIVLTLVLYFSFIFILLRNFFNNIKIVRFLQIYLVVTFIIYNIKGIVIGNNEIIRFSILFIVIQYLTYLDCKKKGE